MTTRPLFAAPIVPMTRQNAMLALSVLARTQGIEVGADNQRLGVTLHSSFIPSRHLNKYGQEYSPEKPKSY